MSTKPRTAAKLLRAMLDTNVVLAAHLTDNPRSPTAELIVRWRRGEFIQPYSTATMAELRGKMVVKHVDIHIAGRYIADLLLAGERVKVTEEDVKPVVAADLDDDLILACAVKGRADYLVTYDPHLLELGNEYEGIRICDGLHFLYVVRGDIPPDENG